jgi:HEAT repeat protein
MRLLQSHRCCLCVQALIHFLFLCVLLVSLTEAQEANPDKVSSLIDQLKHGDSNGRKRAAVNLGDRVAIKAVPYLIKALTDPAEDEGVRIGAAYALGEIGEGSKTSVPQLVEALVKTLPDRDQKVSRSAAISLGNIGSKEAVPYLIEALKNGDEVTRFLAADACGRIGAGAKDAVPYLKKALKEPEPQRVRDVAAIALGKIGAGAKDAVPALIEAFKKDPEDSVRSYAVAAVGEIGASGVREAVPVLIDALKDVDVFEVSVVMALEKVGAAAVPDLIAALSNGDPRIRRGAADALGRIGESTKEAVPQLIELLKDSDENVRHVAAEDLDKLSTMLAREKATQFSSQLKTAADTMRNSQDSYVRQFADRVQQASDLLRLLWWEQLKEWLKAHPTISTTIAVYSFLLLVWLSLLWIHPFWLLNINEALSKTTEIKLPAYLGGFSVAPRYLFLVGFFHYHPRVLDAWVAKYIDTARKKFSSLPTMMAREIYVPLPVVLGVEAEAHLSPVKLRGMFSNKFICLHVWGEGGSGKTALAGRLAHWAMAPQKEDRLSPGNLILPVLIEQDLVVLDKHPEHPLFKAIKQQVKGMIDEDDPPAAGLLQKLLKKRRVLVIIDGFSEMSEASRAATLTGITDLPINAVIITTRTDEQLTGMTKTEIKPLRVRGNRLSTFMETYLTARKRRDLFDDEEFFEACRRLSLIVGDRDITALLAKLYAEQIIAMKEGTTDRDAPENIPELMLSYLNDLCRGARPYDPDIRVVHRAAKSIAWECLRKTLKPIPAQRGDVLSALGGEEKGKFLLDYLEEKLKVVQTLGVGRDRIRFALDPLAEYLAGLHLVAENGEDEDAWRSFLAKVDEQEGAPEDIKGFLLALRDCCLAKAEGPEGLRKVADELAQRAGVTSEESDRYKIERRVRQLRTRLKSADVVDRVTAAGQLASFGFQARPAIKELCALLRDQNVSVRSAATIALGFAGKGTQEIIPHLITALKDEDVDVRRNAADALGRSGDLAKEAVPHLIETLKDPDERVRKSAVGALGDIGPDAKSAAPHLAERLEDSDNSVRGYSAIALGQIGESTTDAIIQLSKALRDSDRNVRMCAATALENIGERAREAVPYLIEALKDSSSRVRSASAKALRAIGAGAEDNVSQLIDDLRNPNEDVRQMAAYALAETGFRTHEVIPQLLEAMKNSDANVRRNAAYALGTIGPVANDGVPHLIEALKDPDEKVRTNSVYALAKIGLQAKGAVPALNKALEDLDQGVRLAASVALAKIGEAT